MAARFRTRVINRIPQVPQGQWILQETKSWTLHSNGAYRYPWIQNGFTFLKNNSAGESSLGSPTTVTFGSFKYRAVWMLHKSIWSTPTVTCRYTTSSSCKSLLYGPSKKWTGSHQIFFRRNKDLCTSWKVENLALILRVEVDGFSCKAFLKCLFLIMLHT